MSEQTLELSGLDGGNPLAFLAALGTLRALTRAWPDRDVRMSWTRNAGWRPEIDTAVDFTGEVLVDVLKTQCREAEAHPSLSIDDDLTISPEVFRKHCCELLDDVNQNQDWEATGFIVAFGCDAISREHTKKPLIADTALRTMSGAGHQHFLATMRRVLKKVSPIQIGKTLFHTWAYEDPLQNFSLRFDPEDDKRYALQWDDPSGDPTRKSRGNMIGANALAVLGISMLSTAPVGGRLETTGFSGHRSDDCFWTWPIWEIPIGCDVVRSLLNYAELQKEKPDRGQLRALGITEVYRSQRITVQKFRNFTQAAPV